VQVFFHRLAAFFWILILWLAVGCANYKPPQLATSEARHLSVSASSLNFQTVVVGQTGKQTLQVSNTGSTPVQITALSVSDKQFTIAGPAAPLTVSPAQSLSYTLTFKPASAAASTATLDIASNESSTPLAVSLTGTGEKAFADLVISPASVNFGNQTVKTTKSQRVTLQNTGDINLTIQGVTVAGSGFSYTSLAPGVALAPNQQMTFQVSFTPAVAGSAGATMSFLSASLTSPATLRLAGDGVTSSSPTPAPPPTPAPQTHTVHLTWKASSSPVIGYMVYRSDGSSGTLSPLFGTAISALTYDDATVTNGSTYYYAVTAVNASGAQSVDSNEVSVAIP
jgi:P pilus assembly chaperone PapD